MKLRNKSLFNALLGAGLYLLDPVRDRLAESIEDFTDRAQDTYETASERMDRASRVIRGDDPHFMSTTTALLIGVGLGVSVGLLFAPASGEEFAAIWRTRSRILATRSGTASPLSRSRPVELTESSRRRKWLARL